MTTSQIHSILASERIPAEQLLKRIAVCLAAYFDPDNDPEIRAGVRTMYAKALGDLPGFAVLKAFSEWERTGTRRPSPAELRSIAERELKPLGDELAKRKQQAQDAKEEQERRDRDRVTPEAMARILAEAGMTEERTRAVRSFPLAGSVKEAMERQHDQHAPGKHWSDDCPPDDPRWEQLRRAREKAGMFRWKQGGEE